MLLYFNLFIKLVSGLVKATVRTHLIHLLLLLPNNVNNIWGTFDNYRLFLLFNRALNSHSKIIHFLALFVCCLGIKKVLIVRNWRLFIPKSLLSLVQNRLLAFIFKLIYLCNLLILIQILHKLFCLICWNCIFLSELLNCDLSLLI